VLTPKPETDKLERANRKKERRLNHVPAEGWHFESTVGVAVWGLESECQCNALTADMGMYYLNRSGLVIGTQFILTNTVSSTLSPTFKLGYHQINRDGFLDVFSASMIAGPSIGNVVSRNSSSADNYSGFIYGGEISLHPRLGHNSQIRGVIALGWLTHRETFEFTRFGGDSETKMTHSGLRIRLGLTL